MLFFVLALFSLAVGACEEAVGNLILVGSCLDSFFFVLLLCQGFCHVFGGIGWTKVGRSAGAAAVAAAGVFACSVGDGIVGGVGRTGAFSRRRFVGSVWEQGADLFVSLVVL